MIDLRSDSLTKPSDAMRAAIVAAEVGDDVYGEDPTVRALEQRVAQMLGHEAGLFVPTGVMANLIAYRVQTRPGDSIILSDTSHTQLFEGGNVAAFGGLLTRTVPGEFGLIAPEAVARTIMQIDDPHFSQTTLLVIENTTNRGGGTVYTLDQVRVLRALCDERGIAFHCDGARFFNATVALGIDPAEMGMCFHSLFVSFSKGLGCPAGSVLVGTKSFIHDARRYRKMLGGGMRQAGVLAAACLHALEEGYIDDLAKDHARAERFRNALAEKGFTFPQPSPTNMVYIRVADPFPTVGALAQEGLRLLPNDPQHLRVMFHRDITDEDTERAIEIFSRVAKPA